MRLASATPAVDLEKDRLGVVVAQTGLVIALEQVEDEPLLGVEASKLLGSDNHDLDVAGAKVGLLVFSRSVRDGKP